jgi:hypothetical protein
MTTPSEQAIDDARYLHTMLHTVFSGRMPESWIAAYPDGCDLLVRIGVCKYDTSPDGRRLELAYLHAQQEKESPK